MNTQNPNAVNPSLIRWTAVCYLQPTASATNDFYKSASHVVGIFFTSEAEAKNAAIDYFNHHPCVSYLVYQQAVECADIGRSVAEVSQ